MDISLAYTNKTKRIWPTLLSAAGQAAIRSNSNNNPRSADVHTAVIMSRTAFDAYLHEMISLRSLPRFVEFSSGRDSRKQLSRSRWRMVAGGVTSLRGLSKQERAPYADVYKLDLEEKIQTILLLLEVDVSSAFVQSFEAKFETLLWLNRIRNAVVHHDFGPPSNNLLSICSQIVEASGLSPLRQEAPWEDLLMHSEVAIWSCRVVASAILSMEAFDRNRRIHISATRDAVLSAISPLELQ